MEQMEEIWVLEVEGNGKIMRSVFLARRVGIQTVGNTAHEMEVWQPLAYRLATETGPCGHPAVCGVRG